MAHLLRGAPLLVLQKKMLAVAHCGCGAPLLVCALYPGVPLLVLKKVKKLLVVADRSCGAPLLVKTSNGAWWNSAPLVVLQKKE